MGFSDRLSRGWGFIKEAFAMANEDRSLLKPSVYSVVVGIVYWLLWVGVAIGADIDFESSGGVAIGALATFGSFAIFYFFMGMTVNMIDAHIKGDEPSLRDAFNDAKKNFVAILFLALISTVVELFCKVVRNSAHTSESGGIAIVLHIVASIIESLWTMVAFLLLPAIIIEDASLGDSLRRVREISKGNFLEIAIGDVGVRMITGLIGLVIFIVLLGVLHLSFGVMGGTFGMVLGISVGGTILTLYVAFSSYLRMAYYTCLYIWAADSIEKGPSASAPLPLARVLNR